MMDEPIGTGDRFQQETKYHRAKMAGGFLDWGKKPREFKEYPGDIRRFSLCSPNKDGGGPLWEVMTRRRSARDFLPTAISFEELSQLIWSTQGITGIAYGFRLRIVPSAGALYPIETYIVINRVVDLTPGSYHFNVKENQLEQLAEGDFNVNIAASALDQSMAKEAAAVFVWTAVVERTKWKYRERGYRYLYLDAGHIGQNLYLAATSLGLGCCTIGAFYDDEVNQLIGVDGKKETVLYLGAVGHVH
ncbi:MAG: SagB/ThcOx family dehydrogenase [Thermodesulfobacteriota bacterium]